MYTHNALYFFAVVPVSDEKLATIVDTIRRIVHMLVSNNIEVAAVRTNNARSNTKAFNDSTNSVQMQANFSPVDNKTYKISTHTSSVTYNVFKSKTDSLGFVKYYGFLIENSKQQE